MYAMTKKWFILYPWLALRKLDPQHWDLLACQLIMPSTVGWCHYISFVTCYNNYDEINIFVPKLISSLILSCSLISKAGILYTPFSCSFRFCCSSFFNPLSSNPLAAHAALSSGAVMSLKSLIPPFLLVLPAGPAWTILQWSARNRCGYLKL